MINSHYKRIMIVGNNGSGKSYAAKKVAEITGLPLVHLDLEYWKPNWGEPSKPEWIERQKELVAQDAWIIEGMHANTMYIRYERADLVIFLDVNRLTCLFGVVSRLWKSQTDMPKYLERKFDAGFIKLCKGLWSFNKDRKKKIFELHTKYSEVRFVVIKGRRNFNKLYELFETEQG